MDSELERYFPELVNVGNWKTLMYNPFMSNVEDLPTDDCTIQHEFIDLINNGVLQSQFENKSLSQFWISLADIFPNLVEMVYV